MKRIRLFAVLIIGLCSGSQAQVFTWMKGSSQFDQPGAYGSLGVPAMSNGPGARWDAVSWKDASGNFWMFGGFGVDGSGNQDWLNDLWKYSPATNQWTWVKGDNSVNQPGVYGTMGVPAAANKPPCRGSAMGWTDNQGNLWLFGGWCLDAQLDGVWYNDLWRYNIPANEWTWMKGSSLPNQNGTYGSPGMPGAGNCPGARYDAASWADASGRLWLFGGISGLGYFNDLWRYDPASNQWAWMSGSSQVDQSGTYGSMGTPAAANTPGARVSSKGVRDAAGNLWLFGGFGFDAISSLNGDMNDLWKYSITTNQWTWMGGNNIINLPGYYGTQGVPAASNQPGARQAQLMWTDAAGNFWMFGGFGLDESSSFSNQLNDLWKYTPASGEWTWVQGTKLQTQPGVYGIQGTAAPANVPGARKTSAGWVDNANDLWLFGGVGYGPGNSFGEFNDLWKFSFCTAAPLTLSSSQPTLCNGGSATLSVSGALSYTWSSGQSSPSLVVSPTVSTMYTAVSTDGNGCNGSASLIQQVGSSPSITVISSKTITCKGEAVTFTVSGAASYSWHTVASNTGSTLQITPTVSATYTVTGMGSNGCKTTSARTHSVALCTSIPESGALAETFKVYPNPSAGNFYLSREAGSGPETLVIINLLGQEVFRQILGEPEEEIRTGLGKGLYYGQVFRSGKVAYTARLVVD